MPIVATPRMESRDQDQAQVHFVPGELLTNYCCVLRVLLLSGNGPRAKHSILSLMYREQASVVTACLIIAKTVVAESSGAIRDCNAPPRNNPTANALECPQSQLMWLMHRPVSWARRLVCLALTSHFSWKTLPSQFPDRHQRAQCEHAMLISPSTSRKNRDGFCEGDIVREYSTTFLSTSP